MSPDVPIRPLAAFVRVDQVEQQIDFASQKLEEFLRNDVVRARISGSFPRLPDLRLANFIESILHDVDAEEVDFAETDFKDTVLREATFSRCRFDNGTFATSFVSDSRFSECTFYNAAAHNTEFHRVTFVDCNLTNFLIKSSRFVDCEFDHCQTSNKLIEMSTLDRTRFTATDIQLQTITGNFGLALDNLDEARIRSGRIRENYRFLAVDDLEAELESDRWSAIEKLRILYFLRPDLTHGAAYLDQALDLARWTAIYKNPGSFIELLESFSEFLVHLYVDGRLTAHPILLLHAVTSQLTEMLPQRPELHRVAMSIGGTHMILARLVEEFLGVLQLMIGREPKGVQFLAEGPSDISYFEEELAPWFDPRRMSIRLRERNSPLGLDVVAEHSAVLVPLIAAFLATRTKVELTRLRDRQTEKPGAAAQPSATSTGLARPDDGQIFKISAGFSDETSGRYEIQVRSLLPGSLLIDLQLNVSTRIAGKLRRILLDLLMPAGGEVHKVRDSS